MVKIVGCCGIVCSECPAYVATQKNDDGERRKVAELWSKEYGGEFKEEDINCDGCLTKSQRVFSYCNVCEIRKCGQGKEVENCAHCEEYACEKLSRFLDRVPDARRVLEDIRATRA